LEDLGMGSGVPLSRDDRIRLVLDGDGIATVTIDRAEKRNALALSMWRALGDAFGRIADDPACRSAVLVGAGPHFCAGADIAEFKDVRATAEAGLAYDRINDETTRAIRDCPKPVIAAVSGYTVGGGLGIALACDFRVADRSVRMGISAGRLGLVYSVLDSALLAERVGITAAKEVLFTASVFAIEDCKRLGLVDRVVGADGLSAARDLAAAIARNAPLSIAGNKAILNALADGSARFRMSELEAHIARAFDSGDYAEGQRAFAERRHPVFTGA
jgi:enoyl-CoA hydratase/carnithine racemase